jgi:SNF2 family DNA or RNA helicase
MTSSSLHPLLVKARETGRIDFRIPPDTVTPAWRESDAQRVGIAHMVLSRRMILADPTGTGKTPTALIAWGILNRQKGWPALVCTPQSNLRPWVEKAELFIPGVKAAVYHGEGRERVLAQRPNHIVTTYETAVNDAAILRQFFGGSPPVTILDEGHALNGWGRAHKLKDPATGKVTWRKAVRRPGMAALTAESEYVWMLTATPAGHRLGELAAMVEFLVPGLFGGEFGFTHRHVKKVVIKLKSGRRFERKPTKLSHYQYVGEFVEKCRPYILRREIGAFGEVLPPVDWREIWSPLDEDHRRLYQTVLDKLLPATVDRDERLLVDIAAHTYAQIISDAPPVLGYETRQLPAKARDLARLLTTELQDEKTLIYCRYAKVADWLAKALKGTCHVYGKITGSVSGPARDKVRAAFNQGQVPGGLILTNAGAEALDLQAARAVVFYDLPWGVDDLTQTIGRARRIGSRHASVLVYVLGHEATLDRLGRQQLNTKHHITSPTISLLTSNRDDHTAALSPMGFPVTDSTQKPKNENDDFPEAFRDLPLVVDTNEMSMSTTSSRTLPSLPEGREVSIDLEKRSIELSPNGKGLPLSRRRRPPARATVNFLTPDGEDVL